MASLVWQGQSHGPAHSAGLAGLVGQGERCGRDGEVKEEFFGRTHVVEIRVREN